MLRIKSIANCMHIRSNDEWRCCFSLSASAAGIFRYYLVYLIFVWLALSNGSNSCQIQSHSQTLSYEPFHKKSIKTSPNQFRFCSYYWVVFLHEKYEPLTFFWAVSPPSTANFGYSTRAHTSAIHMVMSSILSATISILSVCVRKYHIEMVKCLDMP